MPLNSALRPRSLASMVPWVVLALVSCSEAAKQEPAPAAASPAAVVEPVKAEGRPAAPAQATPENQAKAQAEESASVSAPAAHPAAATPAAGAPRPAAARPPYPLAGEEFARPLSPRKLATSDNVKPPKAQNVPSVVPWTEAGKYVDQNIVMQGKVVRAVKSRNVVFLNFDQNWKDTFYVVVFKDAWKDFEQSPEKLLLNKTVRVTGKVYTHDKRPQMRVTKGSQVEVIEE